MANINVATASASIATSIPETDDTNQHASREVLLLVLLACMSNVVFGAPISLLS